MALVQGLRQETPILVLTLKLPPRHPWANHLVFYSNFSSKKSKQMNIKQKQQQLKIYCTISLNIYVSPLRNFPGQYTNTRLRFSK